jgi:hypothetical protein
VGEQIPHTPSFTPQRGGELNPQRLNKANPKTWRKLKDNYYYSKDKSIIYYLNRVITEADAETFELCAILANCG